MNRHLVRRVLGVALHFPQPFAVVSPDLNVGEVGRAQTPEKAERLSRALDVLARFERGELVEVQVTADRSVAPQHTLPELERLLEGGDLSISEPAAAD